MCQTEQQFLPLLLRFILLLFHFYMRFLLFSFPLLPLMWSFFCSFIAIFSSSFPPHPDLFLLISSRYLLLFGASEGNTPLGDLLLPERANCLSDLCSCLSSRTSRISTKRDLLSVEHFLIVFFCHPLTSRTSLRDLESAEHLIAFVCH